MSGPGHAQQGLLGIWTVREVAKSRAEENASSLRASPCLGRLQAVSRCAAAVHRGGLSRWSHSGASMVLLQRRFFDEPSAARSARCSFFSSALALASICCMIAAFTWQTTVTDSPKAAIRDHSRKCMRSAANSVEKPTSRAR